MKLVVVVRRWSDHPHHLTSVQEAQSCFLSVGTGVRSRRIRWLDLVFVEVRRWSSRCASLLRFSWVSAAPVVAGFGVVCSGAVVAQIRRFGFAQIRRRSVLHLGLWLLLLPLCCSSSFLVFEQIFVLCSVAVFVFVGFGRLFSWSCCVVVVRCSGVGGVLSCCGAAVLLLVF